MDSKEAFNNINIGDSKTFDINIEETYDNQLVKDKFVLKYSNIKDTINIKIEESKLRKGLTDKDLDQFAQYLIEALATLKSITIERPDWVKDWEVLPTQLILDIYIKYVEQVQFFRNGGHQKDTPNKSVAGSKTSVVNG